ncbi:MAG: BLUF domain-containing protein [Pseudomonadota bacterium]
MNNHTSLAMTQLAYISRTTFKHLNHASGIEPEVARILRTSRKNNAAKGLTGTLYYHQGYFFQVPEGEDVKVNALFTKIGNDPATRRSAFSRERESMRPISMAGR